MLKSFYFFLMLLLVAGCSESANKIKPLEDELVEIVDNNNQEIAVETKANNANAALASQFGDLDSQFACIKVNPQVKTTNSGTYLFLCSENTGFIAQEFPESDLILYEAKSWDQDLQNHLYSLRSIKTNGDYEQKTLIASANHPFASLITNLKKAKGIYFAGSYSEEFGHSHLLLGYQPQTEDFVYLANNKASQQANANSLTLISSVSTEVSTQTSPELNCYPLDLRSEDFTNQAAAYTEQFPGKLPCYNSIAARADSPVGFYDFRANDFVK
jgi:hypothetical protein